jgi:hypothetical protein
MALRKRREGSLSVSPNKLCASMVFYEGQRGDRRSSPNSMKIRAAHPTCSCSAARRRMAHCVGARGQACCWPTLRSTPCRGFTPKPEAHTEIKPAHERDTPAVNLPQLTLSVVKLATLEDMGQSLEIVVVSSDRDEAAFVSYDKEMPFPASSQSRGTLLPL